MEEFKIKSRKELAALSQEELKAYYKNYEDYLKAKMKKELREKAEYEKVQAVKNINHAMYLVAGELFNSEYALPFLKDLAMRTRFTSRHTEDLNLLMEAKGLAGVVKFIPCSVTKKEQQEIQTE